MAPLVCNLRYPSIFDDCGLLQVRRCQLYQFNYHQYEITINGGLKSNSIFTKHGTWAKNFAEMAINAVYEWSIIRNILKASGLLFLVPIFIYVKHPKLFKSISQAITFTTRGHAFYFRIIRCLKYF